MKNILLLFVIVFFGASACTDVSLVDPAPGGPSISFVDIQPRTLVEFKDSITITISYVDPDGDLGHIDPDVHLITIQDLRLNKPDGYYVPLLAPLDAKVTVEGELEIKLKNTYLLGSGGDEQTTYEVIMKDRAGNVSNPVITDPITITKE